MEPNFQTWLETAPYEDWQKQLVVVIMDDYQEYLEEAKKDIATSYGNDI